MLQIVIYCKHGTGEDPDHSKLVPDYHPLSREEISQLLEMAKNLNPVKEWDKLAQIRVRLGQGIMGMTCPRPMDDRQVARNLFRMEKLFVKRHSEGATSDLVGAFDALLNWHE